jgi:unsaturated chondroitin disaccharide hydrolase
MRTSIRTTALLIVVISLGAAAPAAGASLDDTVREDLEFAREQLAATAASVPADSYPARTAPSGVWVTTGAAEWTSGFFPGSLWLTYAATGDPYWRTEAEARQAGLRGQRRDTSGNDQGFKVLDSFGNGYRLTGQDSYRRVAVRAAESLASRFGPVVGATRSWGDRSSRDFTVIVDNLMNLELLFWASKHGGDPAWYGMGLSHALRTMRTHVRRDGSAFHVVDFNPGTGGVRRKRTRQGYAQGSTWSRGQAWAAYGFTMAYRETGDRRLLDTARRVADWFVDHLPPDSVPYWDFDAPRIPNEPRDSSAAAIAASGLLELAALEPDPARAARYRGVAESIIASLSSERYLARGQPTQAILLHGTQDKPKGNFDTGLSFGDYYFIEALLRYRSPPAPEPGPELEVVVPGRERTLTAAIRRRLHVTVRSDEPGRVRAALLARRRTARRLDLRGARSGVLGRGRARLEQPSATALHIRLARGARRLARRRRHAGATVSVVIRAADGRASATAVPLRL